MKLYTCASSQEMFCFIHQVGLAVEGGGGHSPAHTSMPRPIRGVWCSSTGTSSTCTGVESKWGGGGGGVRGGGRLEWVDDEGNI